MYSVFPVDVTQMSDVSWLAPVGHALQAIWQWTKVYCNAKVIVKVHPESRDIRCFSSHYGNRSIGYKLDLIVQSSLQSMEVCSCNHTATDDCLTIGTVSAYKPTWTIIASQAFFNWTWCTYILSGHLICCFSACSCQWKEQRDCNQTLYKVPGTQTLPRHETTPPHGTQPIWTT